MDCGGWTNYWCQLRKPCAAAKDHREPRESGPFGSLRVLLDSLRSREVHTATGFRISDLLPHTPLAGRKASQNLLFRKITPLSGAWRTSCNPGSSLDGSSTRSAQDSRLETRDFRLHPWTLDFARPLSAFQHLSVSAFPSGPVVPQNSVCACPRQESSFVVLMNGPRLQAHELNKLTIKQHLK
jgi:hypothetical protein